MIYLKQFRFPTWKDEDYFIGDACDPKRNAFLGDKRSDYYFHHFYPFRVLSEKDLCEVEFAPITIFHGGNGTGKSTALNVISEAVKAHRGTPYNTSCWMSHYIKLCSFEVEAEWKKDLGSITHVMTSDEVFKTMLENRMTEEQRLRKSEILRNTTNRKTSLNRFLSEMSGNIQRGYSNGESGMMYLAEQINEPGLYLLDEPENSLSSEYQEKLAQLINYTAGQNSSQFIIATHSPCFLSIPHAKIYDLDNNPAKVSRWWELENMQSLYRLFKKYDKWFENNANCER